MIISAAVTIDSYILPAVQTVVLPGSDFCLTRAATPLSIMTVLLMITLTVTESDESETTPSADFAVKRQTNE